MLGGIHLLLSSSCSGVGAGNSENPILLPLFYSVENNSCSLCRFITVINQPGCTFSVGLCTVLAQTIFLSKWVLWVCSVANFPKSGRLTLMVIVTIIVS